MARLNVYLPDDLAAVVKNVDGLNVSAVLQQALRGLLNCDHERMVCADCGESMNLEAVSALAMEALYRELLHAWQPLVDQGGTAEGAARIAKAVAVELGVPGADMRPLPRPARSSSRRSA